MEINKSLFTLRKVPHYSYAMLCRVTQYHLCARNAAVRFHATPGENVMHSWSKGIDLVEGVRRSSEVAGGIERRAPSAEWREEGRA